jgi:hypothetical protein
MAVVVHVVSLLPSPAAAVIATGVSHNYLIEN